MRRKICCEYYISLNTSIVTEEPAERYYVTDLSPEREGQSETGYTYTHIDTKHPPPHLKHMMCRLKHKSENQPSRL